MQRKTLVVTEEQESCCVWACFGTCRCLCACITTPLIYVAGKIFGCFREAVDKVDDIVFPGNRNRMFLRDEKDRRDFLHQLERGEMNLLASEEKVEQSTVRETPESSVEHVQEKAVDGVEWFKNIPAAMAKETERARVAISVQKKAVGEGLCYLASCGCCWSCKSDLGEVVNVELQDIGAGRAGPGSGASPDAESVHRPIIKVKSC